jgi:hypothetical protein
MQALLNVPKLFNRGWPKSNMASEKSIGKRIHPPYLRGWNWNKPPIFFSQTAKSLNRTRIYRDVKQLGDGAYLFMIQFDPKNGRYYKKFAKVTESLEMGVRHFQLPSKNKNKIVIATGELVKRGNQITYNFESGTYMRAFLRMYPMTTFHQIFKNAMRNSEANLKYTNQILLPTVPAKIKNLIRFVESGRGVLNYNFDNVNSQSERENAIKFLRAEHKRRLNAGESSPNSPSVKRKRSPTPRLSPIKESPSSSRATPSSAHGPSKKARVSPRSVNRV